MSRSGMSNAPQVCTPNARRRTPKAQDEAEGKALHT